AVGDGYGVVVSGARTPERVYYHMYAPEELERDLRADGFQPTAVDTRLYLMHYVAVKHGRGGRPVTAGRSGGAGRGRRGGSAAASRGGAGGAPPPWGGPT